MQKFLRRHLVLAFPLLLIACYSTKSTRTVSDFCTLYQPFPNDLDAATVAYWQKEGLAIKEKIAKGDNLTPQQRLFSALIENVGLNDTRYRAKNCDEI